MNGNFQTSKSFNISEREYRSLWPVIKIACNPTICWDRALVLYKKNLPGRGLIKFEKHWSRVTPSTYFSPVIGWARKEGLLSLADQLTAHTWTSHWVISPSPIWSPPVSGSYHHYSLSITKILEGPHVRNYHYSLHNNPEERSSHLLRSGSLKSRKIIDITTKIQGLSGK
jgi:hypothetical protein